MSAESTRPEARPHLGALQMTQSNPFLSAEASSVGAASPARSSDTDTPVQACPPSSPAHVPTGSGRFFLPPTQIVRFDQISPLHHTSSFQIPQASIVKPNSWRFLHTGLLLPFGYIFPKYHVSASLVESGASQHFPACRAGWHTISDVVFLNTELNYLR